MKNTLIIAIIMIFLLLSNSTEAQTSCVSTLYTGSPSSSHATSGYIFTYIENPYQCGSINAGNYYLKQYHVEYTIYGDFQNATIQINNNLCIGWDATFLNQNQCPWGGISEQHSNYITLYTHVYEIRNSNYTYMGWYPCEIQNARVAYQICKTIPSIVFQSNMPKQTDGTYKLARGTYGKLWPLNTNNVNCYIWC